MANTRNITPGRWLAGLSLPFLATPGMVVSRLNALGLSDVKVHGRKADPLPLDPRADPTYRDDWGHWVEATYNGPSRAIDLGPYVRWLIPATSSAHAPQAAPAPAPTPISPPPARKAPTDVLPFVALVVAVLYLTGKRGPSFGL